MSLLLMAKEIKYLFVTNNKPTNIQNTKLYCDVRTYTKLEEIFKCKHCSSTLSRSVQQPRHGKPSACPLRAWAELPVPGLQGEGGGGGGETADLHL